MGEGRIEGAVEEGEEDDGMGVLAVGREAGMGTVVGNLGCRCWCGDSGEIGEARGEVLVEAL